MFKQVETAHRESREGERESSPGHEPATIAVLDDDPAVLRSMVRLLGAHGFDVRPYTSATVLLSEIASVRPSCLIVDLAMPGLTGLDVQRTLADRGLACPLVFVTAHGDIRTSVQAMRGGAVDFLTKPIDMYDLLNALNRAVSRGREVRALDERRALFRRRVDSLTPREREVFEQVIAGLLNKQIAAKLCISEKTVKVHRGRVMRKMSVRSLAELVRVAQEGEFPASA